jgi:mercuric ion transport protein
MGGSRRAGAGLGVLALVAFVVCCAGPVLVSAGVLAAVGTWLRSALVIGVAALFVAGAVGYTVYRRRRGDACPPARTDSRATMGNEP